MATESTEFLEVMHLVPVAPDAIFAILTDPRRHSDTEPGDWVREAVDKDVLTGVDQVFGMNMVFPGTESAYVMHNKVVEFDADRTIAWMPGSLDEDGNHVAGGWIWRYELTAVDRGTKVKLTYDWTATPADVRASVPRWPAFGRGFLHRSLDSLEASVAR